ncbi:MAG: hypothetical protein N3B18_11620 [Desulfobacterota bacterium]|nr:hypothetical protein [Thermodesulfobacteriota bacterium]
MSLHKKTHRILLIIGFIYLMMCPIPRLIIPDICKSLVAGITVQTHDNKIQRLQSERVDGKNITVVPQQISLFILTLHGEEYFLLTSLRSAKFLVQAILSTTRLLL